MTQYANPPTNEAMNQITSQLFHQLIKKPTNELNNQWTKQLT